MSIQTISGGSESPRPIEQPPVKKGEPTEVGNSKVAQPEATPPPAQPSSSDIKAAMEQLQKAVKSTSSPNLSFSVDSSTGKNVVRVTDRESGELIRQIPSEELLEIARSIDKMQGLLLKQKA